MLNLSPAIIEAKINYEECKTNFFDHVDLIKFYGDTSRNFVTLQKAFYKYESSREVYNNLVEAEAKANGVSSSEIVACVDAGYAEIEEEVAIGFGSRENWYMFATKEELEADLGPGSYGRYRFDPRNVY